MKSEFSYNTTWRKVASTIYKKPVDSKIYGTVELDVTELEKYIAEKRKNGIKTTLTYILTLIVGRAIKEKVPEINTYIRRGKIIKRNQVNAMVSVLMADEQMGSVKIENTDELTTDEITEIIPGKILDARKGMENNTMQSKNFLSSIPWPFRNWFFQFYKIVTIHLGFSFPLADLDANSFGSYVISNIGSVGLDSGYGALLPSSNISIVLIMGSVNKKPVVIDNKIVPRKIMSLSATLDHRVVDASHGGKLFRAIKYYLKNPELLESPPNKKMQ